MDQVAAEVAEAYAQVVSRREQITLAQSGITAAQDSYRRNSERVQGALGLPIEALQSIQALDSAQRIIGACLMPEKAALSLFPYSLLIQESDPALILVRPPDTDLEFA